MYDCDLLLGVDNSRGDKGGEGHKSSSDDLRDSGGSDSASPDSDELRSFRSGGPSSGYLSVRSNSLISYADRHLKQ